MVRITVLLPDELGEKVIELAKIEKRSKSTMAVILLEESPRLRESLTDYLKNFGSEEL